MENDNILITLGHNSSAIFVGKDGLVIGYEQERLDRIKASSAFPHDAISEITKRVGKRIKGCNIYISHWFNTDGRITTNKYIKGIDIDNLEALEPNFTKVVSPDFTHHDAHAYSALAFFNFYAMKEKHKCARLQTEDLHVLVADGFGNNEEVLSLYKHNGVGLTRLDRKFGFMASLGLMYQYATSYVGMKENQDEYKFLGYEAHIDATSFSKHVDRLDTLSNYMVAVLRSEGSSGDKAISLSEVINTRELSTVKKTWYSMFDDALRNVGIDTTEKTKTEARIAIGYLIQRTIERFVVMYLKEHNVKNIVVAGGIFYNVKLNNYIQKNISGLFSAVPLAGDQGAAIGMLYYDMLKNDVDAFFPFNSLCIGERDYSQGEKLTKGKRNVRFITVCNDASRIATAREIADLISKGSVVNVMHGPMEFGPRALGNTTTLMLPLQELVTRTNSMNSRNEIMPCAPIMTQATAEKLFRKTELDKVIGSNRFMICTHDYKNTADIGEISGVAHKMPFEDKFTGRPQIVENDSFMALILKNVEYSVQEVLVNTSFNAHGRPIAFSIPDALHNFEYQYDRSKDGKVYLYIINDEGYF